MVFGERKKNGFTGYRKFPSQRQSIIGKAKNKTQFTSKERPDNGTKITQTERRKYQKERESYLDSKFDFEQLAHGEEKRGWIFQILATTTVTASGTERSGVEIFFVNGKGRNFKGTILHRPYFYVLIAGIEEEDYEMLVSVLVRMFEPRIQNIEVVNREDLDERNHLVRNGRKMLKLSFDTVSSLVEVRNELMPIVKRNAQKTDAMDWTNFHNEQQNSTNTNEVLSSLVDLREYDVSYVNRCCIDLNIRAGTWFTVKCTSPQQISLHNPDATKKAEPKCLAFDIECAKAPLKFPSAEVDPIYMISYMISPGEGFLITNREIVSEDIHDFEYTPKPTYPGPFKIWNERNEEDLIRRFLSHIEEVKPQIIVTYNGDNFDWPYLEARAKLYRFDLSKEIGIYKTDTEYRGRNCIHLDAMNWVKRDSYLPQGSQNLKAVTKYKLGYDPVSIDPEDMLKFAQTRPVYMATYSVSDAVATFYLYEKYVHLFIFSLCTIIPLPPEDVLRKGSGTLCEALLMVQAFEKNIICPNKHVDPLVKFHQGHLLESETYIGGKVECLETGVYRSDFQYDFNLNPSAYQGLIDNIDRDLTFAIEVEAKVNKNDVVNYDEVKTEILTKLEALRDRPVRTERPFIYHLDVGAMYPNIILTNRLQPHAIVNDAICAACDFNKDSNKCKRVLPWVWRGDYTPASHADYLRQKEQLFKEDIDGKSFSSLSEREQEGHVAKRVKQYSHIAYGKTKITKEELKMDTVCMRENDFYVDTVRKFRDRRYEYKAKTKYWKSQKAELKDIVAKKQAEDAALVFDSLQVAHKCILNSFYGYVMRKGARWRSMEMGGIVTKCGADLITQARKLVEQIGRPLELDTDGIWCIIPQSFPNVYAFLKSDGKKVKIEYPCVMLNADVNEHFTNHQYQTLVNSKEQRYDTKSECSIFFEVDGPYRCMVLPSSTEENKLLKKRYAVFNEDGSLAELKGFELKRRGELEIIKTFQQQVFQRFLDGENLHECYQSVADIANHWLDLLDTHGESVDDEELFELICENRNMSKQLDEYGDQKGTSQTTAKRLGEFLGSEIIKDKGLNCKFIIAEKPYGAPVTERAIPVAIWKSDDAVKKFYLRKWLKAPGVSEDDFDIRNVLDWEYYRDRFSKTVQRIITIPAALQKIPNPVPRVPHPEWLQKTVRKLNDRFQQKSILNFAFRDRGEKKLKPSEQSSVDEEKKMIDIEDIASQQSKAMIKRPTIHLKQGMNKNNEATIEQSKAEKVPLDSVNFEGWLTRKKSLWREARSKKRKAINSTLADTQLETSKKQRVQVSSMEGFIRNTALTFSKSELQIIEIRESLDQASDEVIVWIMVNKHSLQRIMVSVPRVIYINCKLQLDDTVLQKSNLQIKKVDRYLPHGKPLYHLYEVQMTEQFFRKGKWTDNFSSLLSDSGVTIRHTESVIEGVYETCTPLHARALSELGCICKVSAPSESQLAKKRYHLSELTIVEKTNGGEYLNKKLSYRRIFFYEFLNSSTGTGINALFLLENGSGNFTVGTEETTDLTRPSRGKENSFILSATCHFWIVRPKGQKNLSRKRCEEIFYQMVQEFCLSNDSKPSEFSCLSPNTSCHFEDPQYVSSPDQAHLKVNKVLENYLQDKHGPTFLVLNSTSPLPLVRKSIANLNEFPIISLPFPPGPRHNQPSLLPSLNWEPAAASLSLEAFVYMGVASFPRRVEASRFGNIPVGNLGSDEYTALFDVCYTRQLRRSRSLIWANEMKTPDIGRTNLDHAADMAPKSLSIDDSLWSDNDDVNSPTIVQSGFYQNICVEIDLQNLAIAAMTDPTILPSFEKKIASSSNERMRLKGNGKTETGIFSEEKNFGNALHSNVLGDEMSCSNALQVLRTLVYAWKSKAYEHNCDVSDNLLHQFYRLVCSQDSLLHDPLLQRVIHSLMCKCFRKLISEFKRLGAAIICASFTKIVLCTNKYEVSGAKEYIDFVLTTIINSYGGNVVNAEGIGCISLQPSNFWANFLYLDEYNFGGILFEQRECESEEDNELAMELGGENIVPTVVSGWNIIQYLTSDIQKEFFSTVVARLMKDVYKKQIQLFELKQKKVDDTIDIAQQLLKFKRNLVSNQLTSFMTRAVTEVSRDDEGPESFPKLPGSHLSLTDPLLEFIKNVLVVLELDGDVEYETHLLKKSLLAQIGVQEYSSSAQWRNPCASFVLPDLFCTECYEFRDMNVCILPPMISDEEKTSWKCLDCGAPYKKEYVECRLIDIIQRRSAKYQIQDLRCSKTSMIQTRILAEQSSHSAELKLDISQKNFYAQLNILRKVAEYHELDWLLEIVQDNITSFRF